MGDRANVYVKDDYNEGRGVYLYTHNTGYKLPEIVRQVLARKANWNGGDYLARMIFCKMVEGDETGTMSFGIGAAMPDNNNGRPIIVVDPRRMRLGFAKEGEVPTPEKWITFEKFVEQDGADWP